MTRTAILLLLLAVSYMDSRAEDPIQYMNVSVGQDVMLPCPCGHGTKHLAWQIDEDIIVNHCCEETTYPDKFYVNRTQLFLSNNGGTQHKNCSLLLRNVSLIDKKNFTCYTIGDSINVRIVGLNVEAGTEDNAITANHTNSSSTTEKHIGVQTGFFVGILLLILAILAGLVLILLIRKHRQRRPRLVVIQDPQGELPILSLTPV